MKISSQLVINILVYLLLIIILTNLNFILLILNGTLGLISPIVLLLTGLGLVALFTFKKNKLGLVFLFFLVFLVVYLMFGTLSLIDFKISVGDYLKDLINYIKSLLIFILFYLFFKNSDSKGTLINHIVFIAILLTMVNFTIFFMDYYDQSVRLSFDGVIIKDKWARATGVWGNANKAGAYCLINIILWMYITLKPGLTIKIRLILFLIILFLIYCIYLTLSNTIFIIALGVILIYLNFFSNLIKLKTKVKIIGIGLIGIMLFLLVFGKHIYAQYSNLTPAKKEKITNVLTFLNLSSSEKEVSFSDRDVVLKIGIEKIIERPIFGNGLGSFKKDLYKYDGIHNLYIQILGEGGIIPFLIFIFFCSYLALKALKTKDMQLKFLLLSFLLFMLLFSLTTHGLFVVNGYCILFSLFFVLFENSTNKSIIQ